MTYQGLYGTFPFTVSDQEVCTFRLVRDFVDLPMTEAMQRMIVEIGLQLGKYVPRISRLVPGMLTIFCWFTS